MDLLYINKKFWNLLEAAKNNLLRKRLSEKFSFNQQCLCCTGLRPESKNYPNTVSRKRARATPWWCVGVGHASNKAIQCNVLFSLLIGKNLSWVNMSNASANLQEIFFKKILCSRISTEAACSSSSKQKPWTILLSQPWTYHSSRVLGANSSATSTIVHREGLAGPVWRLPNSSDDRKWAETYLWSMWGGRRWNLSVMTWIVFRPDLSCWWKFCLEKNLVWSRICLEYSGSMWLCTHSFAAKGKSWFGHLEANCSYWVSEKKNENI